MGHEQPREVHFGLLYLQVGANGVIYISQVLLCTLRAVVELKQPWLDRKEMVNG